jgi:WD40 repeat protein
MPMKMPHFAFIVLTLSLIGCGSEVKKDPPQAQTPAETPAVVAKPPNPMFGLTEIVGATLKRSERTLSLAFSRDGKILATGGYQNIALWNLTTGTQIVTLEGDKDSAEDAGIVFSPDGKTLVAASERGPIKIWDMETKKEKSKFETKVYDRRQLCFSTDGKTLFGNETRCWDVASGNELKPLLDKQRSSVYSPGEECVASNGGEGPFVIAVLELPSGKKIAELPNMPGMAIGVSMPAKRILCEEENNKLSVWDFSGKKIADLVGIRAGECRNLAISHDGKFLVAGTKGEKYSGFLKVWDFINCKELNPIHNHKNNTYGSQDFYSVAFSWDDKLIAVGSGQEIILWSTDFIITK